MVHKTFRINYGFDIDAETLDDAIEKCKTYITEEGRHEAVIHTAQRRNCDE